MLTWIRGRSVGDDIHTVRAVLFTRGAPIDGSAGAAGRGVILLVRVRRAHVLREVGLDAVELQHEWAASDDAVAFNVIRS